MNKTVRLVVRAVICAAAIVLLGCSDGSSEAPASVASAASPFSLTEADFESFLNAINRSHIQGEQRERLKQEWRRKTLFAQQARDAGLDQDAAYQAKLAQFQREALAQAYVEQELARRLTDTELKPLFEARKATLVVEEIHLATLFFQVANPQDVGASLAIKQRVESIAQEIAGGKAFMSFIDETLANGSGVERSGDMGWVPARYAQAKFGPDVMAAQVGGAVGPLSAPNGWYLVQVVEGVRERVPEFEHVRRQLIEQERARVVEEIEAALLER